MSKRQTPPPMVDPDSPAARLRKAFSTSDGNLVALRLLRDDLDDREQAIVFHRRHAGATWDQIGLELGITRQAAQQRFTDAGLIDRLDAHRARRAQRQASQRATGG